MEELYRILKVDGLLHIELPVYPNTDVFKDPTHKQVFTQDSFNYFIAGTEEEKYFSYQTTVRFDLINKRVTAPPEVLVIEMRALS